jgi:hypothetical protein
LTPDRTELPVPDDLLQGPGLGRAAEDEADLRVEGSRLPGGLGKRPGRGRKPDRERSRGERLVELGAVDRLSDLRRRALRYK